MIIDGWTFFGLLGNLLYTIRVLVQWLSSEKAKKSVAPRAFWWLSLAAAFVLIIYSLKRVTDVKFRESPTALPLLVGYIVTLVPYMRNLMLCYRIERKWHIISYIIAFVILVFCMVLLFLVDLPIVRTRWFALGALGSLIWYSRFLWQWAYAEKMKKSVFPVSFWYISLVGLLLNLFYSIIMNDLVFILSFVFNIIPITRNIVLMKKAESQRI